MLARCDLFRISGSILLLRVVMLSIFLWLFVYVPGLVCAQNPNGALRGEIQDAKGARVVNARIVAQATGSSMSRAAAANGQGEFRIEGLLPGSYQVIVTAQGFAEAVADVDVAVSAVRDIKVILKPESGRETVNVLGTPSSITSATIDRSSAVRGGVVGSQDLESLPLPARSFANIAYLVPGTEPVEPSDQGAHYRCLHRRELRLEQRTIGGRCRQLG
jgi:hypothetical protein